MLRNDIANESTNEEQNCLKNEQVQAILSNNWHENDLEDQKYLQNGEEHSDSKIHLHENDLEDQKKFSNVQECANSNTFSVVAQDKGQNTNVAMIEVHANSLENVT